MSAHTFYALVAAFSAFGVVLGAFAYFGTNTGVTGTVGALLALFGAFAVMVAALACLWPIPHGVKVTLDVLLVLGTILTAFAAWMLMQYLFSVAMVLSFLALVAAIPMSRKRRPA